MKRYLVSGLLLATALATWQQAGRARGQADPKPIDAQPPAAQPSAPETFNHIYDVRDLIKPVKDYPLDGGPMPLTRLGEAVPSQPQFQQQNGPLPQPMLDPAQQQAVEISNRLAALSKVITDNIDKTSWQGNGGTVGFIGSFDGQLVVTQTAENHKAIEKLLDELRARGRAIPVGGDRRQHGRSKPAGPCGETAVSDH